MKNPTDMAGSLVTVKNRVVLISLPLSVHFPDRTDLSSASIGSRSDEKLYSKGTIAHSAWNDTGGAARSDPSADPDPLLLRPLSLSLSFFSDGGVEDTFDRIFFPHVSAVRCEGQCMVMSNTALWSGLSRQGSQHRTPSRSLSVPSPPPREYAQHAREAGAVCVCRVLSALLLLSLFP